MTLLVLVLIICFGAVLFFGAPYVPTLKKSRTQALDLLDLKAGQTLYELGCGDGSLVLEAARRGLLVVGYELNPIMAVISFVRTIKYRKQVKIVWGNFWTADLSKANGVYVFLLDKYMDRLDTQIKLASKNKKIKLVSYAFKIKSKKPVRCLGAMTLYEY